MVEFGFDSLKTPWHGDADDKDAIFKLQSMLCHLAFIKRKYVFVLPFIGRRRVIARFKGKNRRVRSRRRWTLRVGKRRYGIRGFLKRRLKIRVNKRTCRLIRRRRKWYIRYRRRRCRVRRRGRRRYIRWRRKKIYLRWRLQIRFKGRKRIVKCRRGRFRIKFGRKFKRITRRRIRFIRVRRRKYRIVRRGRRYKMLIGKRLRKIRVFRKRRRRRRRRRKSRVICYYYVTDRFPSFFFLIKNRSSSLSLFSTEIDISGHFETTGSAIRVQCL